MSTQTLLLSMAISLLLTIAVEVTVGYILGARKKQLIIILAVNLLTNPAVNALYHALNLYTDIHKAVIMAALEISAVTAEWIIYSRNEFKRPLVFSVILNAASYFTGVLLNNIF
ncbi:MAG: hypothetical protein ACI4JF_08195 [Oscillospiraceae bacterium]